MPMHPARVNRGPAAAADNREAILKAARRLFTTQGYQVPRSAIAKAAGIGQGVLYRHFPHRFDLAFEVFEANLLELERIATDPSNHVLAELWEALLEMTVKDRAFVEMMVEARHQAPDYDGHIRLQAMLSRALPQALADGVLDPEITVDDLIIGWRMSYGLVATAVGDAGLMGQVKRSLPLSALRHVT